jgi:hypothetical protein
MIKPSNPLSYFQHNVEMSKLYNEPIGERNIQRSLIPPMPYIQLNDKIILSTLNASYTHTTSSLSLSFPDFASIRALAQTPLINPIKQSGCVNPFSYYIAEAVVQIAYLVPNVPLIPIRAITNEQTLNAPDVKVEERDVSCKEEPLCTGRQFISDFLINK